MVTRFDRLDLEELYNLVMKRFETTTPEGVDLVLWGDLRIMFDANAEDRLWQNQERWNLKSWDFYENCGVHTLILEDGTKIYMLVERKYPLTKETLKRMLSLRLVAGTASEDAYTLLRFIQKHIDEYGSHDEAMTRINDVEANLEQFKSETLAWQKETSNRFDPVNTAAPKSKVNDALPTTYSYIKAHSPVRRAFNQKLAAKTNNFNEKINTARVNNVTTAGSIAVVSAAEGNEENAVKFSACWIWRPTGNVIDHNSKDSGSYMLKRFDYVDLQGRLHGCSRHMTGNKSFLTDYQDIDGGFVAFGGSPKGGKITRKGKIRTGKLDFEDVYFVKELKFNLFSVLQMRDKKNSVLFTETEIS
ncbi:hypothetical protein Tco_0419161 [Tanacetum coccineum]